MQDLQKHKVAIYLRVSTDEQTKGYGLIYQEEKLRAFIASQEYVLDEKHVYKDEGYSGTLSSETRPALKRLMEDASKKEFEVILVYRLDRLFRKTGMLIQTVEKLGTFGVGFKSITETFDTTNSTGKFVMTMLGAMAEMERDTIRERTVNGRTAAVKAGKWAVGLPPYGYRVNKKSKKLLVVEEEAKIVRQMYEWIAYDRLSLKKVAAKMNSMGVNTPKYGVFKRRKTFNHWYERSIGRILTNEIYTGITYFRKYKRPFKNLTSIVNDDLKRPTDDWIQMRVPPIISPELYEATKKQLMMNRENASRNQKRTYLYSKLIYCGECGYKMQMGYKKSRVNPADEAGSRHYHGIYRKTDAVGTTKRCKYCDQYSESRLEPIWTCLKQILQNPKILKRPLEKYRFKGTDKNTILKNISERESKIETVKIKEQKLAYLYFDSASMDKKQFDTMHAELRREKEKQGAEILKLKQGLLSKEDEKQREKTIVGLADKIRLRLESISYEEKRKIINLFIERINIHQRTNTAEVVFRFPIGDSPNNVNLVLNVKTLSEKEIRQKLLMSRPSMYRGSKTYENIRG